MGWLNQISGFTSIFPEMFDTAWDNISPGLPFIGDAQQFNYQKRLQQKNLIVKIMQYKEE